jgi:antagonist of KipI
VVELHFPASSFYVEQPTVLCLAGADFTPVVDGLPVPMCQPVAVAAGSLLSFRGAVQGRWCYLSVMGHLDLPAWLNSYSTHTAAGAGGWNGSVLRKGAVLPFRAHPAVSRLLKSQSTVPLHWKAGSLQPPVRLSFVKGPEWHSMTREAMAAFVKNPFTVSRQSDRMGYRLLGTPLALQQQASLLSSAVSHGTLQLLPDGQLIALMADHQTTGGYPRIAHVITAHQPPPGPTDRRVGRFV